MHLTRVFVSSHEVLGVDGLVWTSGACLNHLTTANLPLTYFILSYIYPPIQDASCLLSHAYRNAL